MKLNAIVIAFFGLTFAPQEGPHVQRTNRVWSIKAQFISCGVTLQTVNTYEILPDRNLTPATQRGLDYFILQWSKSPPEDSSTYSAFDLLADMGQEIYLLHITGIVNGTNRKINQFVWVSPFGYSKSPIPKAPLREFRPSPIYSSEDLQHLRFWISNYHSWTGKHFWYKFGGLVHKLDISIDMPLNVSVAGCKEL